MKHYTTPEQTAKLIELGFEKPKSIEKMILQPVVDGYVHLVPQKAYSIGELIEILSCLPMAINISGGYVVLSSLRIGYEVYTRSEEPIDSLFEQIVKLKEVGVI